MSSVSQKLSDLRQFLCVNKRKKSHHLKIYKSQYLVQFLYFSLNFGMYPLYVPVNKWSIAIKSLKWFLLWYLRGGGEHLFPYRYGRTYFAIDHLLTGTYRSHIPKLVLKSQKLNEMLRFVNFEITRFFPVVDTRKSA